jgi:hypothetical protein
MEGKEDGASKGSGVMITDNADEVIAKMKAVKEGGAVAPVIPAAGTPSGGTDAVETKVIDFSSESSIKALSETLGFEFANLDDLKTAINKEPQKVEASLPDQLKPIAEFLKETGRPVDDWFKYQAIDPSEMEVAQIVKYGLKLKNPEMSDDDINFIFSNTYKLDSEEFSEDEVRMSKLQLDQDARGFKTEINKLKDSYKVPVQKPGSEEEQSPFTSDWVESMKSEVSKMEAIEFDLDGGAKFSFGLNDSMKAEVIKTSSQMEGFFDQYVGSDGAWDYEKLTAHNAIIQNAGVLVRNAYKQGMSDGAKGVVSGAINPSTGTAQVEHGKGGQNTLASQIKEAIGGGSGMMSVR